MKKKLKLKMNSSVEVVPEKIFIRYPTFADYDRRMATFGDRKHSENMVKAGFWRDARRYRTFCCGLTIKSTPDNPFRLHGELNPSCKYIKTFYDSNAEEEAAENV